MLYGGIVKIFSWFVILALGCIESGWADNVTFADALRNVRSNCSGISEKLSEKKLREERDKHKLLALTNLNDWYMLKDNDVISINKYNKDKDIYSNIL